MITIIVENTQIIVVVESVLIDRYTEDRWGGEREGMGRFTEA